MKVVTINIFHELNSPFAVSTEEGEKIFSLISEQLNHNKKVDLDFKNVQLIVSTFLNAAIGQLYGVYSTEIIQQNIGIINMAEDDLNILKKVTDTAKLYFYDKSNLEDNFKKHFPDA